MTNSIIGYNNIYRDGGTVTASSDPADTPKENAIDWRLEDYWQPAAATSHTLDIDHGAGVLADYLAFYSSDLYTEAGAKVEVFNGSSFPPTTLKGTINPTTKGPKILTFTADTERYWRLTFSTTGSFAPKIQIANIGESLTMQRGLRPGFMPPALASSNRLATNISEAGLYIGRSLKIAPIEFSLNTTVLTAAWVRANWPDLLTHIEKYPFFLLPEPDGYADEAVIAWTRGAILPPKYTHAAHLSLNLNLAGFK